jgi:hypothetical protein
MTSYERVPTLETSRLYTRGGQTGTLLGFLILGAKPLSCEGVRCSGCSSSSLSSSSSFSSLGRFWGLLDDLVVITGELSSLIIIVKIDLVVLLSFVLVRPKRAVHSRL